jgi:CBS domain-containing protein
MRIRELMTKDIQSCTSSDPLSRAAQIMWDRDCGVVPIVDDAGRVVAMITDRDICMAAFTKDRAPSQIRVSEVASKTVYSVGPEDALETAERIMREQQVRRLPVVDAAGKLAGLVSINDLSRHVHKTRVLKADGLSGDAIAQTIASIGQPRIAEPRPH